MTAPAQWPLPQVRAVPPPEAETSPIPAYVLGCHEAGLAVIRSLGAAGVPIVAVWHDEREIGRHSRHVGLSVRAPHAWDEPGAYVQLLRELGERTGRAIIFPTTDEAVTCVAGASQELEREHILACSRWDVAERFLNKRLTFEIAEQHGIDAPATGSPRTREQLERLADEISFPCLIKPCSSYLYSREFGVKATRAENFEQLLAAWEQATQAGIETLVQEFIPGPETGGVNYNAYVIDGEPVLEMTTRKLRLWPPDLGFPVVVVSASVPSVIESGRRLLRGMRLSGFANVEFKRDARDGRHKLMEVNGRPNMSGGLAVRCGANFPLLTYRHLALGLTPLPVPADAHEQGVYWINEPVDLRRAATRVRAGRSSVRQQLEPYLRPHVSASLTWDDRAHLQAWLLARARRLRSRA